MSKGLVRSGAIVSFMTLVSRVLGLARDVVIANLMGAGAAADVFFFANKIPNFLRRLFAEGAFAQAFVPVLTETRETGSEEDVRVLLARVSGTLGVLVTIVTLFGVLASPVLAALFGTGWFVDWLNDGPSAEKFELASLMLKITFPYLLFVTLTGLSGAILNTLGKFGVAAFTPVLLNVAIISAASFLSPQLERPAIGLAWGVFFGGMIQLLFQLPFLWRAGVLVKPRWGWTDPGVTKIRKLMIPALFGVSVGQINLLLDTVIATFLVTGSISWLYYSDRLLEFPLGLFGIAIATVILPSLSQKHVNKGHKEFAATMDWAIRMVVLLGLPALMAMIVMAKPMLAVLFMRGAFSPEDVTAASYSLVAYSCGLLSFMLVKVLAPGYYARQDTKTPVRYAIIAMVSNMVFNIIFAIPFGYIGLAIATSLSALVNATLLYRGLHQAGVYQLHWTSVRHLARIAMAATVMTAVLVITLPSFDTWLAQTFIDRCLWLTGFILLGGGVYGVSLLVLGVRPSHLTAKAVFD